MARINTRIARWEDYLLRGKPQTKHVVIPVSPYSQTIPESVKPADHNIAGVWGKPEYLFSFESKRTTRDSSYSVTTGTSATAS